MRTGIQVRWLLRTGRPPWCGRSDRPGGLFRHLDRLLALPDGQPCSTHICTSRARGLGPSLIGAPPRARCPLLLRRCGASAVLHGPVGPSLAAWLRCLSAASPSARSGVARLRRRSLRPSLPGSGYRRLAVRAPLPGGCPPGWAAAASLAAWSALALPPWAALRWLALAVALAAVGLPGVALWLAAGSLLRSRPRPGSPLPPPCGFGASLGSPGGRRLRPWRAAVGVPPPPPPARGVAFSGSAALPSRGLRARWARSRGLPGCCSWGRAAGSRGGLTGSWGLWYPLLDGWAIMNWIWAEEPRRIVRPARKRTAP